jgi:hypothetical protein
MKSVSTTVRDRLVGQPLIGFDSKIVRAPRSKVGTVTEIKTVRAPRSKVGIVAEIKHGA